MTRAPPSQISLEDFCKSHSSFKTKIALLSFYKLNFPTWTEKLLLMLEYLQLTSLIILPVESPDRKTGLFIQIIIYFLKLVNPGYLLSFEKQDSWTFTILIIIFSCVLLKLALFAYILCVSIRYRREFSGLAFLWKWVFKLQTRGIYFLFTSFYLRAIMVSLDGFTPTPIAKNVLITISCFTILIEFLFSLMIETQFCYFLPDKNFLSSKNHGLQITTLIQKLTIQMILVISRSNYEASAWVICCFSFVFNVFRSSYYYRFLPLYHFKALALQGSLLWAVVCLNIAHFAENIKRSVNNHQEDIDFLIIVWIILFLLAQKISSEVLKTSMMKILCTNTLYRSSPEILIHKITATEELGKQERQAGEYSDKYHITQVFSENQAVRRIEIFEASPSSETKDIWDIYQSYCEGLAKKFPHNNLVKLHLAKIYFKNREPSRFPAIIKILNELTQNKWSEYYLTASLLMYELENSILWNQDLKSQQDLDFFNFINNRLQVEKLKKEVLKETELYMQVNKNILSDVSDIGEIYNFAQLIGKSKVSIQKLADKLFKELPDSYASPFLIYARYHLLLNYSLANFDKYMEGFAQRLYRHERYFKASRLIKENLYQDSNAFLLLSSQESDCGKIMFCTKAFQILCGTESSRFIGTKIFNLFPSSLRAYYEELLIKDKDRVLNRIYRGYLSYMNKYLIEVDFCLKYHPYLYQNLCLSMLVRPVPQAESREFLLINENGDIEGASKEISRMLGLSHISNRTPINIKLLSKELFQTTMNNQEALQHGKRIKISSYQKESSTNKVYEFSCHFERFIAGEIAMISVILQATTSQEESPLSRNYKVEEEPYFTEAPENMIFTEREITSPFESHRKLVSSPREALITQEAGFLLQTETQDLLFKTTLPPKSDLIGTNGDENHLFNKDKIQNYLSSHSSQQNQSAEKDTEKAFKAALEKKSYPKSFITLCLVFYMIIVTTFLSQIIMKVVCDQTLDDLGVKKNLLLAAQERSYREMLIQINALSAAFQINGSVLINGVLLNPAITSTNLELHAEALQIANDDMMTNINQLEMSIQKRLFVPNVEMYGTYLNSLDSGYETVTTFQAAEEIINAIKAFSKVTYATLNTTGFHSMFYITQNVFNDLEYENQQIVDILEASVIEEKESYEYITTLCLILTPILLIGIGILLTVITIRQYRIEKRQMKALIKVRSSGMQEISDCIKKFQIALVNEDDLTNQNLFQGDLSTVISLQREQATSGYSKQHDNRTIKYEKFRKRYIQYIIKVFLYLAPLVIINMWDWISTVKADKIIYHKMDQIQFAQYIGNKVTLTYGSLIICFDFNNTMHVKHKKPLEIITRGLAETKLLQGEIYDKFKELDGSFNKEIKDIIYKDNPECARFIGVGIIHCNNLVKLHQRTNMMSTMSIFQDLMVTKLQDFENVRYKPGMMLKDFIAASYVNINILLPSFVLTAHQTQFIVKIVDAEMTKKMEVTKKSRSNILVVFSLFLVMISILFWFQILKKIREVYNDFKKVLKIFPPGLILSSYLLKKFVISTSGKVKL